MKPYTPKASRGLSFPGHIRINRRQLARLYASRPGFLFSGFIVGNNVNTFHFFGGWHLACTLEKKTAEEMEQSLNSFAFYLDPELGNRPAVFLSRKCVSHRAMLAKCDAVEHNPNTRRRSCG